MAPNDLELEPQKTNSIVDGLRPFLFALLLFGLTVYIFNSITEVAQDHGRHIVNMKRSWALEPGFIKKMPGKELVFFMGDSKMVAGIIPDIFDHENHEKTYSYNVALPGLPLAPHYFWLKDYLEKHSTEDHPDTIVIDLAKGGWNTFHFSDYSIQRASVDEVIQYSFASRKRDMIFKYFFPLRSDWPFVKRYLIGKIYSIAPEKIKQKILAAYAKEQQGRETYEHDWNSFFTTHFVNPEKSYQERKQIVTSERGYYYFYPSQAKGGVLPSNYVYLKKGEWETEDAREGEADPFVDRFFQMTERYGIKVILVHSYILPSQENEQVNEIPKMWQDLIRKYPHVSYSPKGVPKVIYPNHLFSDPLHLTKEGAAQFSRHIASVYQDTKKIPEAIPQDPLIF